MLATGIQTFDTLNFDKVLNFHNIIGQKYNYKGYDKLHYLYKINQVFSKKPWGDIIDRSNNTSYPFKLYIRCPWQGPGKHLSLEDTCAETVLTIIENLPAPYYIYWSGGIDSTLALISFLKHVNHKDIVVVYNEFSVNEAKNFFTNHILGKLETHDSKNALPSDCTVITGELGDTVWGILDDGFIKDPEVIKYLYKPWQEYFINKNDNADFLSFVAMFFQSSGRPIKNLLEARWWFYFLIKSQSKATQKVLRLEWSGISPQVIHFYENHYFDTWSYNNTDKFITGLDWTTYKMPAKELIYKYDDDIDYYKNKVKEYSNSMERINVSNLGHWTFNQPLFVTDNYEKPKMPSEPFFSENLYKELFYEKYKHLFMQ